MSGLELEALFGGFNGEPLDDDSREYVFVAPPMTGSRPKGYLLDPRTTRRRLRAYVYVYVA